MLFGGDDKTEGNGEVKEIPKVIKDEKDSITILTTASDRLKSVAKKLKDDRGLEGEVLSIKSSVDTVKGFLETHFK